MALEQGQTPHVPASIERLLRDVIHERTGIFFADDRMETLLEKIQPLLEEQRTSSLLDYYYRLRYEQNGVEDWARVADALSVRETYFYREMDQVKALVNIVIPEWFQNSSRPLRIWSAACASGEEPLSIAMAIMEAGWKNHPIEIVASDASPAALEKARTGVYRENSFRSLPLELKDKYFTQHPQGWKIRPEVAMRVQFHRANLLALDEINLLARAPVIFCRNVFIYFSAHAIRQAVAAFATRMPRGGKLFVGASESLLKLTADFELRELGGAFVYVRI